jgi:hypothetical protein
MPAARRHVPPEPPAAPDIPEPPFYEAAQDLYLGGHAGTMPLLAYPAGARVSPQAVERNGWGGQVKVPDRFAGQLPAPPQADGGTPPPDETAGKAGEEVS